MYLGHSPVVKGGIYELCHTLADAVGQVDTFLDLGARHGEGYELFGRQRCNSYTFVEPSPRCIPQVLEVVRTAPRTSLIQGILGPVTGKTELILFKDDNDQSANLFSDRGAQTSSRATVDVVPYSVLLDHYDMAKVNVEGAEYAMIADALFDRFGSFVMEVHNTYCPGMTYRDAVAGLQDKFDITTHGDLGHRHCFMTGIRRNS